MRAVAVLALCAILAFVAVEARTHHHEHVSAPSSGSDQCNGDDYGTSGQFDYYVFAQSWPASFCQQHMDWPGCSNPTAWQKQNLTLHGMWPNYNKAQNGHDWPQCCQSKFGDTLDVTIAKTLLPAWKTYWPNEQDPSGGDLSSSLWAHEWGKHGTCSGLDQRTYFTEAMTIELGMGTPYALRDNVGGSVSLSDLKSAFKMSGCSSGGDCMAGLSCTGSGSNQQFAGLTTCWSPSFKQIICPAQSLSGQQCTSSQINIPSF